MDLFLFYQNKNHFTFQGFYTTDNLFFKVCNIIRNACICLKKYWFTSKYCNQSTCIFLFEYWQKWENIYLLKENSFMCHFYSTHWINSITSNSISVQSCSLNSINAIWYVIFRDICTNIKWFKKNITFWWNTIDIVEYAVFRSICGTEYCP